MATSADLEDGDLTSAIHWTNDGVELSIEGSLEVDLGPGEHTLLATVVASGQYHTCGLTIDGEVACWGPSFWNVLNVPDGMNYQDVDFFARHGCAQTETDGIVCWGMNSNERLDVPEHLQP